MVCFSSFIRCVCYCVLVDSDPSGNRFHSWHDRKTNCLNLKKKKTNAKHFLALSSQMWRWVAFSPFYIIIISWWWRRFVKRDIIQSIYHLKWWIKNKNGYVEPSCNSTSSSHHLLWNRKLNHMGTVTVQHCLISKDQFPSFHQCVHWWAELPQVLPRDLCC